MSATTKPGAAIWLAEGIAHFEAQRWGEAARAYEKTLELEPDNAGAWYRLGNVRQEQKLDGQAVECFERATALQPSHVQAWNNLGVCRELLGQDGEATEAYRHALAANPSLLQALLNLSHLYMRSGAYAHAVPLLEQATALDESNPSAWEDLGYALTRIGNQVSAEVALHKSAERRNALAQPLLQRAEAAILRGDRGEMQETLAAALEVLPGNPALTHMLAASRGETSGKPPDGYVAALFDGFAQKYDKKMTELLEYRVPELLARTVMPDLQCMRPAHVIDLGCGTGLLGRALADAGARIVGIDLSSRMLERAAQLGVYAELIKGDLIDELQSAPAASAQAVLAADVFVYIGDLQPIFSSAARVLAPGGIFAFSVEALQGGDFHLSASGRYAHSLGYLRELAIRHRFVERSIEHIHPRREHDLYIEGWLACFVAPGATA